jgi:hypothetical protein
MPSNHPVYAADRNIENSTVPRRSCLAKSRKLKVKSMKEAI